MKQKQSLLWLMSLLMLAIAPVFTSCSSDDDDKSDPNVIKAGENDPLGEPIGLVYTDFLTENDVVHNADTTELTISKALADKKGITNFVNHPMGIWDKKEHRAYLRRATEQRLVDDHYVLKVVRSSVAEVTRGQEMTLNTGIYYNPTRMVSRGGLTRASQGNPEADKYIDDNNVIHPAAITVQRKVDDGSNAPRRSRMTRGDGDDGNSATFTVEELFTTQPSGANGWFDWIEEVWNKIVEATSYDWNDKYDITLLHTKSVISKDFKFNAGPDKGDTISLRFRCPIQFDLNYTLNIRSHGSIETAFVPIPSYLETYIDGYFEANPQLRIGFSKTISLPKDKQRITLFSFSGVGFTFMLGPVPLTIDLDPSVYLKFTSTLKGNAYFGVQYDIATKFKAGVKYDGNEWSGIADGEKLKDEFSFINPKVSLEYIGGAGLYFGVDVIIEKVAGPSFNVGPQVTVNAKLSYQIGDDRVKATIEGKAGIGGEAGAKIKIFGFNVAEWKSYFDIGPQWTIFKYPDDGSGSSGNYDPNSGGGGVDNGNNTNRKFSKLATQEHLGWCYASDGYLYENLQKAKEAGVTPMGIVVFVNDGTEFGKKVTEPDHNGGQGLVMSYEEWPYEWVSLYDEAPEGFKPYATDKGFHNFIGSTYGDAMSDYSGYENTLALRAAGYEYARQLNYYYYVWPQAPESSSGWFLPTTAQWIAALCTPGLGGAPKPDGNDLWTKPLADTPSLTITNYIMNRDVRAEFFAEYWTSTFLSEDDAACLNVDWSDKTYFIKCSETNSLQIRAFLAF